MAQYGGKFMSKPAAGLTASQAKAPSGPFSLRAGKGGAPPRGDAGAAPGSAATGLMAQAAAVGGQAPRDGAPPVPVTRPANVGVGAELREPVERGPVSRLPTPGVGVRRVDAPPAVRAAEPADSGMLQRQSPGLGRAEVAPSVGAGLAGLAGPAGQRQEEPVAGFERPEQWMRGRRAGEAPEPVRRPDAGGQAPVGYFDLGPYAEGLQRQKEYFDALKEDPGAYGEIGQAAAAEGAASEEELTQGVLEKLLGMLEGGADSYFDEGALESQYSEIDKWHAKQQEKLAAYLASKGISGSGVALEGFVGLAAEAEGLKADAYQAAQGAAQAAYQADLAAWGALQSNLLGARQSAEQWDLEQMERFESARVSMMDTFMKANTADSFSEDADAWWVLVFQKGKEEGKTPSQIYAEIEKLHSEGGLFVEDGVVHISDPNALLDEEASGVPGVSTPDYAGQSFDSHASDLEKDAMWDYLQAELGERPGEPGSEEWQQWYLDAYELMLERSKPKMYDPEGWLDMDANGPGNWRDLVSKWWEY